MDTTALGVIIFNKRTQMQKTQEQFGDSLGVRQQTVQRWESGSLPGKKQAKQLAKILDIRLSDIEGLRDRVKREKALPVVARTGYVAASEDRLSSRERYLVELLREDDCPVTADQLIKIILEKKA